MSTATAAFAGSASVRSSEHDLHTLTAISIKPLLKFITEQCLASMPSSGLNIVDFVLQVLTANKEQLDRICQSGSFGSVGMQLQNCHTSSNTSKSSRDFNHSISSKADPATASSDDRAVAGSEMDALHSRIRDLELQLANAHPAVNQRDKPLPTCDAVSRDVAEFQRLYDATVSSLQRKNKDFMGDVYNRHARPIGLSARALVTALHAIDPLSYSAEVADVDALKKLKELDSSNKGHCSFEEFCAACKVSSDEGADVSPARVVFLRLADVKGLTAEALMDALKEVDAPVLSSSEGRSPEQIFRRADANLSGSVDLSELETPHFF